jgi:hypothetical protein
LEARTYTPIAFRGHNNIEGLVQPVPFPDEVIQRAKARNKPPSIPSLPPFFSDSPKSEASIDERLERDFAENYDDDFDFIEVEFTDDPFDGKLASDFYGGSF